MKSITEILKEFGLEIPADKAEEFHREVAANYKTEAEFTKKIGKAEGERDSWKQRAESAEETLKGFDGVDVGSIQNELATWKQKAADAEKEFNAQLSKRDFEDALEKAMNGIKFTSAAAKNSVMTEIRGAGLTMHDGKIMGLSDLIGSIKEKDKTAFVDEEQEEAEAGKARFTDGSAGSKTAPSMTKEQIMAITDREERRAAIAKNLNLFYKGDK